MNSRTLVFNTPPVLSMARHPWGSPHPNRFHNNNTNGSLCPRC